MNALNTNQRILKKLEAKLIDGRSDFKNKIFVPDIGLSRTGLGRSKHSGRASFANI